MDETNSETGGLVELDGEIVVKASASKRADRSKTPKVNAMRVEV